MPGRGGGRSPEATTSPARSPTSCSMLDQLAGYVDRVDDRLGCGNEGRGSRRRRASRSRWSRSLTSTSRSSRAFASSRGSSTRSPPSQPDGSRSCAASRASTSSSTSSPATSTSAPPRALTGKLFGRWMDYAADGHGGSQGVEGRRSRRRGPAVLPGGVVLEVVDANVPDDTIEQIESYWKTKTCSPGRSASTGTETCHHQGGSQSAQRHYRDPRLLRLLRRAAGRPGRATRPRSGRRA